VAQCGNAQRAVDHQQALQILFAVDFRRLQQQGGRTGAAQLVEKGGGIAPVAGLRLQQCQLWFGVHHRWFQ
jgi:hypothetical protein